MATKRKSRKAAPALDDERRGPRGTTEAVARWAGKIREWLDQEGTTSTQNISDGVAVASSIHDLIDKCRFVITPELPHLLQTPGRVDPNFAEAYGSSLLRDAVDALERNVRYMRLLFDTVTLYQYLAHALKLKWPDVFAILFEKAGRPDHPGLPHFSLMGDGKYTGMDFVLHQIIHDASLLGRFAGEIDLVVAAKMAGMREKKEPPDSQIRAFVEGKLPGILRNYQAGGGKGGGYRFAARELLQLHKIRRLCFSSVENWDDNACKRAEDALRKFLKRNFQKYFV
jgi:hypothetical protein